ncbi:hypothetical protein KKF34_02875 [Myxococcota bacterium]|nr:hypothetical protein [Myxococcota bacterium]MBU1382588.1 hypothetical protein [Myxococcota bacterium]MBU1495805.1 hypothetical protein [Myxococcota bacterium]
MDLRTAETLVAELRESLENAVVATDIWNKKEGISIAGFNSQPTATKLFNDFYEFVESNLKSAQFPALGRYFLLELEQNNAVVIINYGSALQGFLVNMNRTNMGKVVSLAIPRLLRTAGL